MFNKMHSKSTVFTIAIVSLLFLVSISYSYFNYEGAESAKYLLPFLFSLIIVCFLFLTAPFYSAKNFFTNFTAVIPFLVWGGSVMIPVYSDSYWPLMLIILIYFLLVKGVQVALSKAINPLDSNEAFFWLCVFTMVGFRVAGYLLSTIFNNLFSLHIFINWALSPFIFCLFVFILRLSGDKKNTAIVLINSLYLLAISTLLVLLAEMITRGQNFGLNFILHGANGGFSGSDSDVTGGHGEPLVLGMSAAFGAIFCLHLKKNKPLALMLLLSVFSMSLRPMLVAGAIVISIIIPSLLKNGGVKSTIFLLLSLALFTIYSDVFFQKFLGKDSVSGTIDYGSGITVGYNIAYYFRNLQWANYLNLELSPVFQTITSFIVGGNEGTPFLKSGHFILPFFIGFGKSAISLFIIMFSIKKAGLQTTIPLIVLLVIYCYLDPFQPLYRDTLDDLALGSVPRESPIYFFILFLVAYYYIVRFYDNNSMHNFSVRVAVRSFFNRL